VLNPRIAIDAMGGDGGPAVMIAGAALARRKHPTLSFQMFGDASLIAPQLARHAGLAGVVDVIHSTDVIASEDKPSHAIRRAKTTSLGRAINAVKTAARRPLCRAATLAR
jgi:glycerol-3-phosphate acyltransferase PlsX